MTSLPVGHAVQESSSSGLTGNDLASFGNLGISTDLLLDAQVERVTDEQAREKYGIISRGDLAGIVFPYFIKGRRVTSRLRRDNPDIVDGKPKNKYVSAFGERRHLYLPPGYEALLADSTIPILFVEAEKSVLAIAEWSRRTRRKVLPLGTGGCWGWRGINGTKTTSNGEREPEKGPLPEVAFAGKGRPCGILFDANAATNEDVKQARHALQRQLEQQGAKVIVLDLPALDGVNGPDDFIGTCGDQAFSDLLDRKHGKEDEVVIPGRLSITEIANAERLAKRYGDEIRYVSDRRIWCAWTGKHWAADDVMGLSRRMQEVARDIYTEAANETSEEVHKALSKWAQKSESQNVQMNSIEAARCHVEVTKFADVFDTKPTALNAINGTIRLGKDLVSFSPHQREDYITKIVPIEYLPKAKCPQFDNFLNETFRNNQELVDYVQRLAGYFLTGLTSEQKWWMFYGPTASGKSTFATVLRSLLGPYSSTLPENYFLVNKGATDFATANLVGVRLATCVETNDGRRLDVAKIKALFLPPSSSRTISSSDRNASWSWPQISLQVYRLATMRFGGDSRSYRLMSPFPKANASMG